MIVAAYLLIASAIALNGDSASISSGQRSRGVCGRLNLPTGPGMNSSITVLASLPERMKQESAMGRSADITVVNTTDYEFVLQSCNTEHGKFTTSPASVDANSSNQFSVSNKTGSMVGPEGTVTYAIATDSGTSVVATVYYNLPWGDATGTYSFASKPAVLTYQLTPPDPTGHDQSVTLTVSLSPSPA